LGVLVFERFRLVRLPGRDGIGLVWLACDQRLDPEVAWRDGIGFRLALSSER
jgi:hypothetical protein